MVYRLAYGPMFGGHHDLALHQTTSRIFGICQCLFNGYPVGVFQCTQDRRGLCILEIFDQVNDIVAVHVPYGIRKHFRRQNADHFFPDRFVEFRQNLTVELPVVKADQFGTFKTTDLLKKVRDVRRMQRIHQFGQLRGIVDLDRVEDGIHRPLVQLVGF